MSYRWFIIARVLHVLAIVVWIGGIAAVTNVMFPAMRRLAAHAGHFALCPGESPNHATGWQRSEFELPGDFVNRQQVIRKRS